jgi:hypothetical protein
MRKQMKARLTLVLLSMIVMSLVMTGSIAAQTPPLGNGFWSVQTLQNISTQAATVSATAYNLGSGTTEAITSFQIPAGGGKNIVPAQIAGPNDPKISTVSSGSMVVSANQPLVAIVGLTNQFVTVLGVQGGTSAGVYEGTGGDATSTKLLYPILKKNYFGQNTVYFVQNAGGAQATVKATFNWGGGSKTVDYTIDPNRSIAITPPSDMPGGNTAAGLGSAVVESTNNIKLAGAHFELDTNVPSKNHKTARAFVTGDLANVMYVPSFKKGYFGNDTNISIQSPDAAVSGSIEYTCAGSDTGGCTKGAKFTVNFSTAGAGASYNAWAREADHNALPLKSLYSAKITLNSNATAVANVGETGALFGKQEESMYVAVTAGQASAKWACPVHKEIYFDNTGGTILFPLEYPAAVTVDFSVIASANNTLLGNKYQAKATITASDASLVLYDVSHNLTPGLTWTAAGGGITGGQLPSTTGTLNSLSITSDKPMAVVSNEQVHFSKSVKFDARQYNCFPTP